MRRRLPVLVALAALLLPALPTPAAATAQDAPQTSITREEFRRQLLQAFPMEEPGRKGGQLILGEQTDISTVNGILTSDYPTFYVTGSIYETLVTGSPIDGQVVPGLADSWEVAADGITYTFHLNKNAKWHDGTDFTADDVVFSFNAVLDPNTGSLYATTVNDAVESIRAVDPDTVEIKARDKLVTFLYDAPGTVLIMPRHLWQDVGTEGWSVDPGSTGQDPSRVVGTGPFKFKEWVYGDHVTLVRNDAYYDQVPNIDEFIIRVLPDENAAVQALITDETDVLEIIPPSQVDEVEETGEHEVEVYDLLSATFYAYNLDPEVTRLFQDKAVRQALYQALDRDAITESIFLGFGEAAVGPQPKLSPAYAPDRMTAEYPYDPEAARKLLADAGWTDSDDDGTVDKDEKELEFTMLLAEGSGTVEQMATYMQEAWGEVGADVEIEEVPGGTLLEALDARDFELALVAFNFGPDGGQGPLFTCDAYDTSFNFMRYCNSTYDDLEHQQRREFDRGKRIDLLIEQANLVWSDLPVGMMRFGVGRTGYTTRLHNFYPNGYAFLWSLPYVWLEE
jgi:peptide/nickel transport system substrate-binding protein